MRLNESHLMQLAAVLDAGSVTHGAIALGISQPAVSRALSALEARVGKPLFIRGKRPLQATAIGIQLASHGRRILAESRRASETVEGLIKGTAGLVRVAGVPFFLDAMVSRIIADFQNREPNVGVTQAYANMPEILIALENDQIDVGVAPLGDAEIDKRYEFTSILVAHNVIACRSRHPLLAYPKIGFTDLVQYPWVAPLPGSPLLPDLHTILTHIGASELDIRYSGGSLMSVINYMSQTDALAILPYSVVFAERGNGQITVLPLDIPQPSRSLGVVRRSDGFRSPSAERFADHLISAFADLKHLIERHDKSVVWTHST